ncbi:hypothetical protein DPMN_027771 [Dreissena polymorpha]|uniref:Uncharacterized protein n=1 Tax=Dreissena polymorpha TaxID=45954 RepID=A0A9D4LV03_DREPO|nr:hypothetical protein DPMN_027771 [Dreissena polymorpha]
MSPPVSMVGDKKLNHFKKADLDLVCSRVTSMLASTSSSPCSIIITEMTSDLSNSPQHSWRLL